MKPISKLLLRLMITYGLTRREEFEDLISKLLADKIQNQDSLSDLNEILFSQLADLKEYLLLTDVFDSTLKSENDDLRTEMIELKKSIQVLNDKIDLLSQKS